MSLSSYLAQKYLNASGGSTAGTTSKKRKRKNPSKETGLIIADDDALGWTNKQNNSDDEHDGPLQVSTNSAEFRKSKKTGWKVVGTPALQPNNPDDQVAAVADRILAEADKEREQAQAEEEGDAMVVKMGDGTHAGLQSAQDVKKQFEQRKREEQQAWAEEETAKGRRGKKGDEGEETVYRDATGRRIDISMRRQEKRRERDEQERKEREEKDAQKGDVQMAARAKRREELDEARFMTFARGADDEEINRELKAQDRWNDPAMQFLSSKKEAKSASGRPLYKGAAAPNRYGIRPGHRWDGVDRSNGWEAERFKGINRQERNKNLGFAWEMDE